MYMKLDKMAKFRAKNKKVCYELKQVSESIEQDNLELVYSVNYRENIILGSVIGKFSKLTELRLETSIDNVLCQHYELFVKNSYGDFISLLDRGQVLKNLE